MSCLYFRKNKYSTLIFRYKNSWFKDQKRIYRFFLRNSDRIDMKQLKDLKFIYFLKKFGQNRIFPFSDRVTKCLRAFFVYIKPYRLHNLVCSSKTCVFDKVDDLCIYLIVTQFSECTREPLIREKKWRISKTHREKICRIWRRFAKAWINLLSYLDKIVQKIR